MADFQRRVLVIGMDGATLDLVMPWVAQGYLPNLGKLMQAGSYGKLRSTLQPVSAPAWVTFMTGMNQGKHGLYSFVRRREDSYNLAVTNASHIQAPTMFDVLSHIGGRSVLINLPYTAPPPALKGVVIGGPFAPTMTPDLVHPKAYYDVLRKIVPDYFIVPDYDGRASDPMADYAQKILEGVALRERLGLHLLAEQPWDLAVLVFMAPDLVHHVFWQCMEAREGSSLWPYRHIIRDVYQRIDQAIGAILTQIVADDSARETAVLVMSDHGGGEFRWMINLNAWLAEAGYLHFQQHRSGAFGNLKKGVLKRLMHLYRRYVSADVRKALRVRLGEARFERLKEDFESTLLTSNVDWASTRAYSLGAGGNIFLNVRGREPAGIVEPGAAYTALRQEIAEGLMDLVDPETGEPVVAQVHLREALYQGPYAEIGPDLVIEWCDYANWGHGRYDTQGAVFEAQRYHDFSDQPLTGAHQLHGMLIAQGGGIQTGAALADARIHDLAPTILNLLGIAPLSQMDGRSLTELLTPAVTEIPAQHAVVEEEALMGEHKRYTSEEEEKIAEHLRALGYL